MKVKKLLAGIMSATMVLSTMSFNVFAAGEVAEINGTKYATLEAAVSAAQEGETIKLLADAEIGTSVFKNSIDLNEKTITFKGTDNNVYGGVTFSNGDMKMENLTSSANAIFRILNGKVTFSTIKLTSNDTDIAYIIEAKDGNAEFEADNSKFYVTNHKGAGPEGDKQGAVFANTGLGITFNKCEINIENSICGILHKATLNETIYNATNMSGEAIKIGGANNTVTLNKSTVTVDGCENGVKVYPNDTIELKNGSTLEVKNATNAGILLKKDTASVVEENASTIKADIVTEALSSDADISNSVKVSFADVTEKEGEKVYNLYVEAEDAKTINRLTSAQLALKLTSEKDFDFVVSGTDKVAVTNNNGMYLFNFNGETAKDATGLKIQLGQIKVVGYGEFTLSIYQGEGDEVIDNKVHATSIDDNIVNDFVPNAENSKLVLPEAITETIAEPTRKLTINITFPNAVESNVVAYQDMTVTIKGGKATDETINLGEMTDGGYEIERDLVKDTPYTVTVSGAGYRTASYTVTLNDDKTLNFWNNVMTTAKAVEEDKDSSAKTTTFLAGEIVKDGKINIYDLSAVVSYFGTINNVSEASQYAQYDLNRDGKVDSKDVAYVLASFNN